VTKKVENVQADSLSEVLHGFNFLLQDLLLRSGFSPLAYQQLEQHFDNFAQFYGRQKIRTHSDYRVLQGHGCNFLIGFSTAQFRNWHSLIFTN